MRLLASLLSLTVAALPASCGSGGAGTSTQPPPPGKPTALAISAGDAQSGTVGLELVAPIAVKVTDANGRAVPGVSVDFLVTSGSGRLSTSSAITSAEGVATNRWTLGTNASVSQVVVAQLLDPSTGAVISSVQFHAVPAAGQQASMAVLGGNGQLGFPSTTLADPIVVIVYDGYGNPVPNVTVTFAVTAGGGNIAPTTAVTGSNGRASATWTVGAYGAPQAATASVTFLTPIILNATVLRSRDGTSVNLGSRPYAVAISPSDVVYVTQLDAAQVTRYNGLSTAAAATIAVGSVPTGITFDPSGTRAYTADQLSFKVSVIDVATNSAMSAINTDGSPFRVLVSPDGARLYVVTNANSVFAYDVATKALLGTLNLPESPNGLAINGDGTRLYVSTWRAGTVVEINTQLPMAVTRTLSPGGTVQEVQLSADGSELFTVNEAGTLFIYTVASGNLATTVNLGANSGPFGAALTTTPDRTHLFVTLTNTGEVKVVDLTTRTVSRTLYVGGTPRRVAFTSDGTAVIPNEAGYVTWVK